MDTITDFKVGEDKIVLDRSVFAALGCRPRKLRSSQSGHAPPTTNVHLFYNSGTGVLYYDADGSGRGAAQQVAVLQKGLSLSAADFMVLDTKAAGAVASALAGKRRCSSWPRPRRRRRSRRRRGLQPTAAVEASEINVIKGSGGDTMVGTRRADIDDRLRRQR